MTDITGKISEFIANLRYEQLPETVIGQTKLFIADYYAACYAGFRINRDLNEKALLLLEQAGGKEEATVLFSGRKLPAGNAAFMNALYAHGADMDDGNRKAAGHIAAHVMPAVFALAEAEKASWEQVILAIVAGYEVFNRVVGAAQPGLYNKGFHSTGVGGSIACAAACAKLMGLGSDGIYNAISLGAIQASGLIIIDESGQCCKPINPANAARTGLFSAQLARLGVESSQNPLESKKGWYNAFADTVDENILFDGLGETFTICESYLKLYPACRHTHCGIDGALALRQRLEQDGLSVADVQRVQLTVYPSAIRSAGSIIRPKNGDEAKFSLSYCIAAALYYGQFGLDELDVQNRTACFELADKIELIQDAAMEDRAAGIRGCRLTVTAGGKHYEETVLIPKGEAKKPLLWDDIQKKLAQCAGTQCTDAELERLVYALQHLDPNAEFTSLPA